MSEPLLRNALTFWISKLVLKELPHDTFQVLETVSDEEADKGEIAHNAAAAASSAAATTTYGVLADEDAVSKEKLSMYWQYVQAMLTNQGPMPLPQIVGFLSVFVPGGFPFSNDTMKEFLDGMVAEGRLEFVGGNYRIVH